MNPVRAIALLVMLAGVAALVYGGWRYFDDREDIRIGDTRLVVENADIHPAVWIGGALVVAGGITMAVAGGKRN